MKLPLFALLGAAITLVTGCFGGARLSYAAQNDAVELASRTKEVLADGDAGRLSLAQSRKFLHQSKAMVGVIRLGASDEARALLNHLDQQYDALLERRKPLRTSSTQELREALTALVILRPVPTTRHVPMETSSSTDDPAEDLRNAEKCEREKRERREREEDRKDKDKDKDDDDHKKHD